MLPRLLFHISLLIPFYNWGNNFRDCPHYRDHQWHIRTLGLMLLPFYPQLHSAVLQWANSLPVAVSLTPPLPTFGANLAVLSAASTVKGSTETTTERFRWDWEAEDTNSRVASEKSQLIKTLTDDLLSMGWPILQFMTRTEALGSGLSHWMFGEGGC